MKTNIRSHQLPQTIRKLPGWERARRNIRNLIRSRHAAVKHTIIVRSTSPWPGSPRLALAPIPVTTAPAEASIDLPNAPRRSRGPPDPYPP